MKQSIFKYLISISFILTACGVFGQTPPQKLAEKTRILFLLDGSGSMLAKWENTLRIVVAKKYLADFVDSLRVNENLELALRVYGHQYDRRLKKCDDTKLEVPFGPKNHDAIIGRLQLIKPQGTTPISYSLEQAANDFKPDPAYRNIIIIITDGIESCDGDPCAVSLALQKKNIFLKPFVIGIGMDKNYEEAFGCMGSFYDATNISGFRYALNRALDQSLKSTTVSVELTDRAGVKSEKDVNVTLVNSFTGEAQFEFVHYRDRQGRPDSVEVEPVLQYDIVVNTVPPVVKKGIQFEAGKHNVIEIKAPQGWVSAQMPGYTEYKRDLEVLVFSQENNELLTHFQIPGKFKLLEGNYRIETLTIPRKSFKVQIRKEEDVTLKLDQPGVVNFLFSSPGIASLYELDDQGRQRWIFNLDEKTARQTIAIQPGKYKAVYRSSEARGSKFTNITEFEIKPGSSLNIRM